MAASMNYDNNISCFSCIKWSCDNKIALCGDASLIIMNLLPVVEHVSAQPFLQQMVIPVDDDVYDIPELTDNEYRRLIKNLSRDDHDTKLVSDAVMNPNSPVEVARRGYHAAEWSPGGGDEVGRCILAGLSGDFRLCLFSQYSSTFDWHKVCDLTEVYGKLHPFQKNKVENYHEFRQHCYQQAIVTISWNSAVFTQTATSDTKPQNYSILATGSKTGNIVLWRINLPCSERSDCSVLHEIKPFSLQPSCMTWSKASGLLAVGYTDGQIHVLKIDTSDPSQEPTVVSIYSEADLMKISCLVVVNLPEIEGEVILANKEHYILAFKVTASGNVAVMSEKCVEAENILPGTGFSSSNGTIVMSSADGVIQLIRHNVKEGDLELTTQKLAVDVNIDTQMRTNKLRWLIHGVALSPNSVFMAYAARPSCPFDRHTHKRSTEVVIHPLDHLLKRTETLTGASQESSSQDEEVTTLEEDNDRLCQRMLNILMDYKVPMPQRVDVLEVLRSKCFTQKDFKFQNESLRGLSLRELQLKRYEYLVIYHTKLKKPRYELEIVCIKTDTEKQDLEEKRRLGSQLTDLIHKITELIVGIQIMNYAGLVSAKKSSLLRNSQVDKSHRKMLDFILFRPWLKDFIPEIHTAENRLKELVTHVDTKEEKCMLCSSCLSQRTLIATCKNCHSFDVCNKTLLLCDSMDYRTCSVCHSVVLSKARLKDFPWMPGDDSCNLCDGQLL